MSKMNKKYYLKLKDNKLITRCCFPRTFLGTYKLLTDDVRCLNAQLNSHKCVRTLEKTAPQNSQNGF